MKLLNVGVPFKVLLFLNLRLRIDENQRVVVCIKDSFLTYQIMYPFLESLNWDVKIFFINVIVHLGLGQSFRVISNGVAFLFKHNPNSIL